MAPRWCFHQAEERRAGAWWRGMGGWRGARCLSGVQLWVWNRSYYSGVERFNFLRYQYQLVHRIYTNSFYKHHQDNKCKFWMPRKVSKPTKWGVSCIKGIVPQKISPHYYPKYEVWAIENFCGTIPLNSRFCCFFCDAFLWGQNSQRSFEWWTRMQNYERVFCFSSLFQFQVLGKKWYKILYKSFQRLRAQHYDWFAVTSCWSSRKQCWHILRKILHIYNHI